MIVRQPQNMKRVEDPIQADLDLQELDADDYICELGIQHNIDQQILSWPNLESSSSPQSNTFEDLTIEDSRVEEFDILPAEHPFEEDQYNNTFVEEIFVELPNVNYSINVELLPDENHTSDISIQDASCAALKTMSADETSPTLSTSHLSPRYVQESVESGTPEDYYEPLVSSGTSFSKRKQQKPGQLRRFISSEWFYSDIDRVVFAQGNDTYNEFAALVARYFPSLQNCALNRIQLNYMRKKLLRLKRGQKQRRFSQALFDYERTRLKNFRELVRLLQMNPVTEYLHDGPLVVPEPITINCEVMAQVYKPKHDIVKGIVVGVHDQMKHVFRVNFGNKMDGPEEQYIPDYRLARVKDQPEEEKEELEKKEELTEYEEYIQPEILELSQKSYKEIEELEKALTDKRSILDNMYKHRITTEWRRKNKEPITPKDHEVANLYLEEMKQLIVLDRTIIRLEANFNNLCAYSLAETECMEVFDAPTPEVIKVADDLLEGPINWMKQLCDPTCQINALDMSPLFQAAVESFNNPAQLDQFRHYIESTMAANQE